MFAVVSRTPGDVWYLQAGPFTTPTEADAVARRLLRDTPPGEAILGLCPWNTDRTPRQNIDTARGRGAIERVT